MVFYPPNWQIQDHFECILPGHLHKLDERDVLLDYCCHDHTQEGVGLLLFSSFSLFIVPLPRTFQNVLWWPTYFRHDTYSRPFQYDVEWRSACHGFLGLSIWLHMLWTIYYKLYGIKYKYRVVAILYLSLVFVYLLTILVPLSSSVRFELCALLWTSDHCITESLFSQHQSHSRRVAKSHQALDNCCGYFVICEPPVYYFIPPFLNFLRAVVYPPYHPFTS